MKHTGSSWTFINQANPRESIIVHDPHSAECLQAILKHHESWFLREDYMKASPTAEPEAVAPPPKPAVSPAASQQHAPVQPKMSPPAASQQQAASQASAPPPLPAMPGLKPVEDRRFSGKDRRTQQRFSTEFRVVLITGAHSYRNTSEDVSMGGMKLKRPVPHAFIDQKCTIFISHPDLRENVQVSCKVLADPKDPRRIQFTETDPGQLKRLEEWLAETALRSQGVA